MTDNAAINLHKGLVVPVVALLMYVYSNGSTEAWLYLALHGAYACMWLAKQRCFPDARFAHRRPLWISLVFVFLPLNAYFAAPYLLITRQPMAPPWLIGVIVAVWAGGVFLHFVGDAQKYFTLRQARGLITGGLFSRTRNPNYLGEILIYIAFGLLAQHWLPFVISAAWIGGFFMPNMAKKDASLSRYEGFAAYRSRSGRLIPRVITRGD